MTVVYKVGGEIIEGSHETSVEALAEVLREDPSAVVVHGGGPQTSALMRQLGLEPQMVAGQRVTDEAGLQCLLRGVGGEVNARLVSALAKLGVPARGLGVGCIRCVRRRPVSIASAGHALVDYGLVGDITAVDRRFLGLVLNAGMVAVVPCIGLSPDEGLLNVNGDTAASSVAAALKAEQLIFLTSTPGVLRDRQDPSTRIARISTSELSGLVRDRVVEGGMVAKLEEAVRAVKAGVERVLIVGQLNAGDLRKALSDPESVGTSVLP